MPAFLPRSLPQGLEALTDLALDLRWTWSHGAGALWNIMDQESWERTKKPWLYNGQLPNRPPANDWYSALTLHWDQIHFGNIDAHKTDNGWLFQVQIYLGEILSDQVRVELYAEGIDDEKPLVTEYHCKEKITGAVHGYCYQADIETTRDAADFTTRIIPHHTEVQIPAEASLISWQR